MLIERGFEGCGKVNYSFFRKYIIEKNSEKMNKKMMKVQNVYKKI